MQGHLSGDGTLDDVSSYVDQVKNELEKETQNYNNILDTISDFRSERINRHEVNRPVSNLFTEHPEPRVGFNKFQKASYENEIQPNEEISIPGTSSGRGGSSSGPTSLINVPGGPSSTSSLHPTHSMSNHSSHTISSHSPPVNAFNTRKYRNQYHLQEGNVHQSPNIPNSYNANTQYESYVPEVPLPVSHDPPMFRNRVPTATDGLMDVDSSNPNCQMVNTRLNSSIHNKNKQKDHGQFMSICNTIHEQSFNPSVPVSTIAQQPYFASQYLPPSNHIDGMQNSMQFSSAADSSSLMHMQQHSPSSVERPRTVSTTTHPVSWSASSTNFSVKSLENSPPSSQKSPIKLAQNGQNEFSNEAPVSEDTKVENGTKQPTETSNTNSAIESTNERVGTPNNSSTTESENDEASVSENKIKVSCDNHVSMPPQTAPPRCPIPPPQSPSWLHESYNAISVLESIKERIETSNNSDKTDSENNKASVCENKIKVSYDNAVRMPPHVPTPKNFTPNQGLKTSHLSRHLSPRHNMTYSTALQSYCMPSAQYSSSSGRVVMPYVSRNDIAGVHAPSNACINRTRVPNDINSEYNRSFLWNRTRSMNTFINSTSTYNSNRSFSNATCLPTVASTTVTNSSPTSANSSFYSSDIQQLQCTSDSSCMLPKTVGTAVSCIDSGHNKDLFTRSDIYPNFGLHQSLLFQPSREHYLQQQRNKSNTYVGSILEKKLLHPTSHHTRKSKIRNTRKRFKE